jgi:hypothetical protein
MLPQPSMFALLVLEDCETLSAGCRAVFDIIQPAITKDRLGLRSRYRCGHVAKLDPRGASLLELRCQASITAINLLSSGASFSPRELRTFIRERSHLTWSMPRVPRKVEIFTRRGEQPAPVYC